MVITQVDSFTSVAFRGNPAAVCVLEADREDRWMRDVAREMNLSETAFLRVADDGWHLRWFTPAVEVDLCGHATLASAHVLWESGLLAADQEARFHTRSGLLTARRTDGWIRMDFPATVAQPAEPPAALIEALGVQAAAVSRNRFDYLIEVATSDEVRAAKPDMTRLREVEARGVIVTAPSDNGEADFISRFFAPRAGVDEDPVTGSAHCALAPYWGERFGRHEMVGYQASERGGTVRVRWAGGDRVELEGQAVTVLRCELIENEVAR